MSKVGSSFSFCLAVAAVALLGVDDRHLERLLLAVLVLGAHGRRLAHREVDAHAEGGDEGLDLLVVQRLVEAGALDVQDLAAQGQDGLGLPVAGALGGAARRVALDEEQLALARVLATAVGQLAGQAEGVHRVAAPDVLGGLAHRLAGALLGDRLVDDVLARAWGSPRGTASGRRRRASWSGPCTSGVTSLTLSCELYDGFSSFSEMTAVRPAMMASEERLVSFSFRKFIRLA